jgi:hypothetical protein
MDSRTFFERKGIEITKVVACHLTDGKLDGEIIDIELLMNEFRDEILREHEHESSNESAASTSHDVCTCKYPQVVIIDTNGYMECICGKEIVRTVL